MSVETLMLDSRAVLIEAPVVRALTGWRRDEIYERAEGGSLLHPGLAWVWNFAADPHGDIKDLRFWRKEIEVKSGKDTSLTGKFSFWELDWVINKILPPKRVSFQSGEVVQMFALSRPALMRLRDDMNGTLAGARNCFFERDNLAAFLKRRWLGNQKLADAGMALQ